MFGLDLRHLERLLHVVVGEAGVLVVRVGFGVDDQHLRVRFGGGRFGMGAEDGVGNQVGADEIETISHIFWNSIRFILFIYSRSLLIIQ